MSPQCPSLRYRQKMDAGDRKNRKSKRIKILVADDSVTTQRLVHSTFSAALYEVVTADDGQDALTKVRTLRPHVFLLNCQLKQVDGFSLTETIKADKNLKTTKIILLKGKLSSDEEEKLCQSLADDILSKPFDSKALRAMVEKFAAMEDEESTVISDRRPALGGAIPVSQRLEAIAAAVAAGEIAFETDEVTGTHRLKTSPTLATPSASTASSEQMKSWFEALAQEWIEKNLPAVAERLIKDEIHRLTSTH